MDTTGEVDPREYIGAVFEVITAVESRHRGTASIIGDGSVVLTAAHVVIPSAVGTQFAISLIIDGQVQSFWMTPLAIEVASDLALLRIEGYRPPNPLHVLFDTVVSYNTDLLALEYAQTAKQEDGRFVLNPAARRGHKTRNVNLDKMGSIAGVDALELSFPALEGASGAPVLIESTPWAPEEQKWGIVGVLVANVQYHAVPAQVVSELSADNEILEERMYTLPQGVAVNINHLRPLYERVLGPT